MSILNTPRTQQERWIRDNVYLLASVYDYVAFDDATREAVVGPIALPAGWQPHQTYVKILLKDCPFLPPYPLYLPEGLTKHGVKPRQYLSGPDRDGWCKFHVGIDSQAGGWAPTWNAQASDNALTYLRTIRWALTEGIK